MTERMSDEAAALYAVAEAILPRGVIPAQDAYGGHVCSLTEAVMGATGGLMAIAAAIDGLADAIRERGER